MIDTPPSLGDFGLGRPNILFYAHSALAAILWLVSVLCQGIATKRPSKRSVDTHDKAQAAHTASA
jgi:hypothetical protein